MKRLSLSLSPSLSLSLAMLLGVGLSACNDTPGGTSPDGGALVDLATATDAGAMDADGGGASTDGGSGPVVAPAETFTWVDVPDSRCGNGKPTGFGINPTQRSTDVLIYLAGGGACWDATTCFVTKTAVNVESGYDAAHFASDAKGYPNSFAFQRNAAENPFKDASWVLVPYCTGDVHAGDRTATYQVLGQDRMVHHRGAANMDAFLKRLAPTFPGKRRIWLAGSSAGGYGAQFNYHRVVAAFPDAEVHLLADSGPMVQPWNGRANDWNAAWNIQVPAGCAGCATHFPALATYLHKTYPNRRFGLLDYDSDGVITLYFGYPLDGSFATANKALQTTVYDPNPNARYFALPGSDHTMLGSLGALKGPGGLPLRTWVSRWATGDPAWANAR